MNERDDNERDGTPRKVSTEETAAPLGDGEKPEVWRPTDEPGECRVRGCRNPRGTRRLCYHHWSIAIEERVADLKHSATARGGEESVQSVQILDLRTRLSGLVRRVDELELVTETASPTERESDLERALGMRNAENRALEKELAAVRATRERAVGESNSRGVRIEELEETARGHVGEILDLRRDFGAANEWASKQDALVANLEESVRRKDIQIGGLVDEISKIRVRLEITGDYADSLRAELETERKKPTFAHSAEAVIELVFDAVEIDAVGPRSTYIPGNERAGLVAKIDEILRVAARIVGRSYAVLRWTGNSPATERPDVLRFGTDVEAEAAFEASLREPGASQLVAILKQSAQDFPDATKPVSAELQLPESADYEILCNNVVGLAPNGNFGVSSDLIEERFGDILAASTRFDELSVNAAEVRLALVVRRYRRVV